MKQNLPYLKHIADELYFLIQQTKDLSFEAYLNDAVLLRATARSLEIIGEAVKNITPDFKTRYNDIEWKNLAGMRDKIIHFYFGIKCDIVWDVIQNKVPDLAEKIHKSLKKLRVTNINHFINTPGYTQINV